jgi:small subunit ribosomal protein S17
MAQNTVKAKTKKVTKAEAPKAEAKAEVAAAAAVQTSRRRTMVGTVVSDKMQKTIVVKVDRRVRHDLYKKYVTKSRRYKAHDEKNTARVGDLVVVVEARPMSRDKRWALQRVVRRAGQTLEVNV